MHTSYESQHHKRRYLPLDVDRAKYFRDDRVVLEERESDEDSEGNCSSLYKYAIFGFNIIFLVVGVALTAMGAWLRTDSRFRDFLSERYRQAVDEAFWQAPTLYTFSYILLVLGATMIVVAFFGCCGAIQGSRLFLGFYGFSVFMLLIFTVSCAVYILYKKDGIDVELSDALNYMVQHYYQGAGVVQESLDRLQQAFRCCGNAGCSDFRAFRQDPPRTCDIRCDGCHYRIWLALRIGFSVALVIFAIVVLAQVDRYLMNGFNGTGPQTNTSWIRSAISNPLVGDIRRAIRERNNPLGIPFLSQRQNSCPTRGNPLEHREDHPRHVNSTASTSSNGAIVIQMESNEHTLEAPVVARNRRRSSVSASAATSNPSSDINNSTGSHGISIVPELGNLAASYWLNAHRNESSLLNTSSILPITTTSNGTQTSSTESSGDDSGGGTTSHSDEEESNEGHHHPNITSLRALLRNREAMTQFLLQNFGQFPNLHGLNVLLTGAILVLMLTIRFFFQNFGSCFALVLGFFHYQDASRFARCISGAGDVYFPLANILIRNFIILHVLDKNFILSAAAFHDQISFLPNATFFTTIYRVVSTELFIMDIALVCKLMVAKIPSFSKPRKRRVYQWIEYTSTLYRFPIPFVQWSAFLNGVVWTILYSIFKTLVGLTIAWSWFRTTVRLFHYSHLGTMPSVEEMKNAEHCTICYADFGSPIKLNCNHIFCSDCIRTWLDREVTCPICRATVTKEDNNYRNGNSIFPTHTF